MNNKRTKKLSFVSFELTLNNKKLVDKVMEQGQCLTKLLNEVAALSLYERLVVQKATTLPPPRIACAQCAAFRSSLITSDIIY